jgi:imidazolonepropionase-like amidohydrolase
VLRANPIRGTNRLVLKPRSISLSVLAVFAACAACATAQSAHETTLRYAILTNGKPAGSEVDTFHADGTIESHFEFNDRGRGPKIVARYTLGPNGLPITTDITGNDYLKAPVDEHFSFANGTAKWQSTSESGRSARPGFYISNNGSSVESALLVAALVKAGTSPVDLFPAGQAHLEKLGDTTVASHGQKLHVTEYAITGLSFTPQTLWLDDDLHYFSNPGTWGATLREGWEDTNDQLNALTLKADDARYAQLAAQLSHHPQSIAFEHVGIFESVQAAILPDQTVVVKGNRIASIGPAASAAVPANAQIIDGAGKTLLPGLFDMHTHNQPLDGLLHIASGVTSVRDMGNSIEDLHRLETQWDSGSSIGPRVSKAGLIDGPGPFQAPTGIYASTPAEAEAAVHRYADLGYIQIKLYSSLNPDLVPGIVKAAHARGLRVSGHIPNGITASQFVTEGADELQHINFVFLNFLAAKVKDTRTPERFTAVGQYAAGLDLHSKDVDDFIALLKSHHTTVDVTLATFEGMFTGRPKQVSPDMAPILDRLPAQVQRGAYNGGLPVSDDPAAPNNAQRYKDSYTAMLAMTRRLYDAGIPILAGTDATAGLYLHRELELEVQAGIPAPKALQIATYNAAQLLKKQDLGVIAPGKFADLVLVEGNPAEHISDIRRCRVVLKNGVLFNSAELYAATGIQPAN